MTEIRTATAADRAGIDHLVRQLHPESGPSSLPAVRQESRTLVAAEKGNLVGLAVVTLVDYGIEAYGTIEDLVVDETARSRGVGRALLDECRAWLSAEGADVVFVSSLDDAEPFYIRAGFRPCTGPWLFWAPGQPESGQAISQ